jgi:hypothetical protein
VPDHDGLDAGAPDSGRLDAGALDQEDAKLVTLARASRARAGAAEGAAVRDTDGRTYAAATVDLPSLTLTALQAAVAAAASSGVDALEAAAVVTTSVMVDEASLAAVRDLGPSAPVFLADPTGAVQTTLRG